jgi:hypothetical protein
MDYLENQRYIPRGVQKKSKIEIKEDIEAKKCDTCIHYDFYFCKALQVDTAPQRSCKSPESYASKKLMEKSESDATLVEE